MATVIFKVLMTHAKLKVQPHPFLSNLDACIYSEACPLTKTIIRVGLGRVEQFMREEFEIDQCTLES